MTSPSKKRRALRRAAILSVYRAGATTTGEIADRTGISPEKVRPVLAAANLFERPTMITPRQPDYWNAVAECERGLITNALTACSGVVARAARYLQLDRVTLIRKIARYRLRPRGFRRRGRPASVEPERAGPHFWTAVEKCERKLLREAMERFEGNEVRAARWLQLDRVTMLRKLVALDVDVPRNRRGRPPRKLRPPRASGA